MNMRQRPLSISLRRLLFGGSALLLLGSPVLAFGADTAPQDVTDWLLKLLGICLTGFAVSMRFLYYYFFTFEADGKIQSLILSAVLMIVGFQIVLIGLVSDAISGTRKLLEDVLYRVRRMELDRPADRDGSDGGR